MIIVPQTNFYIFIYLLTLFAVWRHPPAHRGQVRPRRRRKDPHLRRVQPQPAKQGKNIKSHNHCYGHLFLLTW